MHIFFYPNRQFNECSDVFFRLRQSCWQAQPHEPVILLAMKTARLVLHKRFISMPGTKVSVSSTLESNTKLEFKKF